jgi:Mg-chelatase subunit ChlD
VEADSPIKRASDRPGRRLRPLARKPKQLTADPALFLPDGGGGTALPSDPAAGRSGPAPTDQNRKASSSGFTDEAGNVLPVETERDPVDRATSRRVEEIARQLAVPRPRHGRRHRAGSTERISTRFRGRSDDIDLDRTIESLVENPVPQDEDIIVHEMASRRRAVVLLVDVSGSMRGERIRTAAATVGALAGELSRDALGVVAFWSDAAVLCHLGDPFAAPDLLDTLLRLPARGLTNVSFPLQVAAAELRRVVVPDTRVVLLSDCVHNAGPDPRLVAAGLPRLDVLLDASGEKDEELGRDLARIGRGHYFRIATHRDVAPALSAAFAD